MCRRSGSRCAIGDIASAHPDGARVLIVCHGGVISAYLAHCLGLPLSAIWRMTLQSTARSSDVWRRPASLSVNDTWTPRSALGVGA